MNKSNPQTPFQEAVSIISIASVLVRCYVAAINEVPLVSEFLFRVAVQVYHRLPVFNALHAPQAPMLFSRAGIKSMERQTDRLKRLRVGRKIRKRNDDDFKVA